MNQLKHKPVIATTKPTLEGVAADIQLTCLETLPASEVTDRDGDTTNIVVA
jgi:hypothetical protein